MVELVDVEEAVVAMADTEEAKQEVVLSARLIVEHSAAPVPMHKRPLLLQPLRQVAASKFYCNSIIL